jgi:hypothetical protein
LAGRCPSAPQPSRLRWRPSASSAKRTHLFQHHAVGGAVLAGRRILHAAVDELLHVAGILLQLLHALPRLAREHVAVELLQRRGLARRGQQRARTALLLLLLLLLLRHRGRMLLVAQALHLLLIRQVRLLVRGAVQPLQLLLVSAHGRRHLLATHRRQGAQQAAGTDADSSRCGNQLAAGTARVLLLWAAGGAAAQQSRPMRARRRVGC